jgi:hypothetical protein
MFKNNSLPTLFALLPALTVVALAEPGNARHPAVIDGANRVAELQRTDADWEGTWYWYVGNTYDATNLTGVTALGLLEAYRDAKDPMYLDASLDAAYFITTHLGAGATGTQHHVRMTAPDIVFLHRMSGVVGDPSFAARANSEWENLATFWPTAGDLDALFRSIGRRSAWDVAFFLEAARLSGDMDWADGAAAILADTADDFYYGDSGNSWYALNLAASVRALVGCGYHEQYSDAIIALLGGLIDLVDEDDGIGGYAQDTAYAVLAFKSVGGAANAYANDLGRWLARKQQDNGGWIEPDDEEYAEANGEAVRALAATIGKNVTLGQFKPAKGFNSSWRKAKYAGMARPFTG